MGYRPALEVIGQDDELIARDIELAQVIEHAVPFAEFYRTVIDRSAGRWSDRAACKGNVETMYPTAGEPVEPALDLCRSCPVIELCCAWGDECEPKPFCGILAGETVGERRERRRALPAAA